MFSTRKLLFCLHLFQSSHVFTFEKNEAYTIPADANELCHYTSFCEGNSTLPFPASDDEMPCCQDCSCAPSCGLHNNCCFKHLDIYNIEEKYQMVCRSLYSTINLPDHLKDIYDVASEPHFRMINKCLGATCADRKTLKGNNAFYPVYSSKTRFIYFNENIAKCNNVTGVIHPRKAILCSLQDVLPVESNRVIQNDETNTDCVTKYIFPKEVNLKSEYCDPEIVRKCNVTGEVSTWEPYWAFCETFNATFILVKSKRSFIYGNVFCFMCNQFYDENQKNRLRKIRCSATRWLQRTLWAFNSLTMILIKDLQIDAELQNKISSSETVCPANHALISSFTDTCRPIKCPFWKVLSKGKCKFYSKQWIGGPFIMVLRLTPRKGNMKILRSFVDDLTESEKKEQTAKWLNRKTLKQWEIKSLYHPSRNDSFIDFFVVSAKCPFHSVNPDYIERQIKATLTDTWYISQHTGQIALKVNFNEFTSYKGHVEYNDKTQVEVIPELIKQMNASLHSVFVPDISFNALGKNEIEKDLKGEVLYTISSDLYNSKPKLFITKIFLCRQVDLLPDEYEDKGDSIFFKVKNVTLRNFRRVKGITHTPSSFSYNSNTTEQSIRICLQEFDHTIVFSDAKRSFVFYDVMVFKAIVVFLKLTSWISRNHRFVNFEN